jgi:LmbE family N-acetylglucosaminyl deacetylase
MPTHARRVAVVSPHLDDAVLSVGASIASAAKRGARITVVTVFAYDLSADAPAGPWDRSSGFQTGTEAGRARRQEDRLACEAIGATPVWLPFQDHEYTPTCPWPTVRNTVIDALADHEIALLPGWPLTNPDHLWVVEHLAGCMPTPEVGFYREQPYACDRMYRAILGRPPSRAARSTLSKGRSLVPQAYSVSAWQAKFRAVSHYRSQLQQLGPLLQGRLIAYELGSGGERIRPHDALTLVNGAQLR